MKKKLKPRVARTAAAAPGPLSQIHAARKTERSSRSATEESARRGKSLRMPIVARTRRTAAGYPTRLARKDSSTPGF
jgi:hypothetical protein